MQSVDEAQASGADSAAPGERDEQLRFEYELLRREILQNQTNTLQVLGGTVLLMGSVTTIALSDAIKIPMARLILLFLAEMIAVFSVLQSIDKENSTFLIASYLRTFVEQELRHVKWETRLAALRSSTQTSVSGYSRFLSNSLLTHAALCAINLIVGVIYSWQLYQDQTITMPMVIAIVVVMAGPILFIVWREATRTRERASLSKRMSEDWQHIRANAG